MIVYWHFKKNSQMSPMEWFWCLLTAFITIIFQYKTFLDLCVTFLITCATFMIMCITFLTSLKTLGIRNLYNTRKKQMLMHLWIKEIGLVFSSISREHSLKGLLSENLISTYMVLQDIRITVNLVKMVKKIRFHPHFQLFLQNSCAYCHPDLCRVSISCHSD